MLTVLQGGLAGSHLLECAPKGAILFLSFTSRPMLVSMVPVSCLGTPMVRERYVRSTYNVSKQHLP